ncbi:DUF948 domain-containing protein [Cellulomonas sp. 73-92]|uniref:DUF948 domain-containing protein n=1 Tax=Cellulomonas sp. 73-92 TaxID=1895740 RepID=UPI0025B7CE7B|nr:DUF948 domain-containing protein [Cellulomonas sp. 73-92]
MAEVARLLAAIAGLLAALGFAVLVGILAVPLVKLGRTFDSATRALTEMTDHTLPVIDEAAKAVASGNVQLEKVDKVTTAAADVSQNVSALTALFAATVGGPMIKAAAFTHGVRRALSVFGSRSKA